MMRFRFSSGLTLGLALGIPSGALLALLLMPAAPDSGNAMAIQVQELTRKLEAAREARERADKQLEQFQTLAEQMTASFKSLESRFKTLEEEQAHRDNEAAAPKSHPPAADPAAPPPVNDSSAGNPQ
jgi:uncharacterized protein HemX